MNDFRTIVRVTPSTHQIALKSGIFTIGSCFADAIGSRLLANKFAGIANPFGVLFGPPAIHKALRYAILNEPAPQHTFLQHHDVFLNYDFHSELSALTKPALEQLLLQRIGVAHHALQHASTLIITYGTSWIYQRNDTGEQVANCHKVPASSFTKSLFTQKAMIESFELLYRDLKKLNPALHIVLTVSPVRHIKDTIELNSISKSILRIACHTLSETFANVEYFPAYEIMMDDLRDYRFYKSDMIHPTEQAEDYIWEKFGDRYFSSDTKEFLKKWNSLRTAIQHKPFQPESSSHQQFIRETLAKLEELKSTVNVDREIEQLTSQLQNNK